MDRDSLRDAIRGTALHVGCHSRDSLVDEIRGTTVFQLLPARLLTLLPLSMHFLIA